MVVCSTSTMTIRDLFALFTPFYQIRGSSEIRIRTAVAVGVDVGVQVKPS